MRSPRRVSPADGRNARRVRRGRLARVVHYAAEVSDVLVEVASVGDAGEVLTLQRAAYATERGSTATPSCRR